MSKKKGNDEVKVLIFQYRASVVDDYQRQLFLFPLVNNNARQVSTSGVFIGILAIRNVKKFYNK